MKREEAYQTFKRKEAEPLIKQYLSELEGGCEFIKTTAYATIIGMKTYKGKNVLAYSLYGTKDPREIEGINTNGKKIYYTDKSRNVKYYNKLESKNDKYFVGAMNGGNLIVRQNPSKSSPEVSKFNLGSKIKIVLPKTIQEYKSEGTIFVKVYYNGNKIGWVSEEFIFPDSPIEFIPPATVIGNHNGVAITLYPQTNWGLAGGGAYKGKPLKENGRYRVAVGPKILRPDYPDEGKVKDYEFNGFDKNIRVILKDKKGVQKEILCVIVDFKAHSFNEYTEDNTDVSFNVENGYVQTGICYEKATNKLKFSPASMDETVIEFCTEQANMDFNIKDYVLVKIIALE